MSVFTKDRQLNISKKYLRPGFAYGGSCLNKDLKALETFSNQLNKSTELLNSINLSNQKRIADTTQQIISLGGKEILIYGLSFKPETDDLRNSPYLAVAQALVENNKHITIIDPDLNIDEVSFGQIKIKVSNLQETALDNFDSIIYFKDLLDQTAIERMLALNKTIFDPELLLYSKGISGNKVVTLI